MSAYWIGRAQMCDLEGYKHYGGMVAQMAALYPSQVLVRAGRYEVLEGPDDFNRFVVLKFPSMEAARAYFYSEEYQAAAAIRREASGRCEITIVEGID